MNRVVKILVCIFTLLAFFVILGVAVYLRTSQDSIQFELLKEVTFHINPQKPDSSLAEQNEDPSDLNGWVSESYYSTEDFYLAKVRITNTGNRSIFVYKGVNAMNRYFDPGFEESFDEVEWVELPSGHSRIYNYTEEDKSNLQNLQINYHKGNEKSNENRFKAMSMPVKEVGKVYKAKSYKLIPSLDSISTPE
ncbi:MAG: hypothetical protein COA78_02020 [Blastopirellula sp.]|nr:MAG: hypothetical protein COA78_02020 [Blastopirellula sp.]